MEFKNPYADGTCGGDFRKLAQKGLSRGAGGLLALVITASIALIFIVNVMQPQITAFYNTTAHPRTGWDPSVSALWTVIIIAIVIGIVVAILKHAGVLHI